MAHSGMLPRWFAYLHPKYRTPSHALLFIGGLSVLAPFFGSAMLGWLVDSGSPSIVVAYLLVGVAFVILRRREPQMNRPLRVGGRGNFGQLIGVLSVLLCAWLISLYLPGMPAAIGWQPWVLFGSWWLLGMIFILRIPRGITPGENAEMELMQLMSIRQQAKLGASGPDAVAARAARPNRQRAAQRDGR